MLHRKVLSPLYIHQLTYTNMPHYTKYTWNTTGLCRDKGTCTKPVMSVRNVVQVTQAVLKRTELGIFIADVG